LHQLRYYFDKYPEDIDKVVLTVKGAYSHEKGPVCSPEDIRASVEEAYKALGASKKIDVFELGRSVIGSLTHA
jgi:pyridoxine 4-dehydrogenase